MSVLCAKIYIKKRQALGTFELEDFQLLGVGDTVSRKLSFPLYHVYVDDILINHLEISLWPIIQVSFSIFG